MFGGSLFRVNYSKKLRKITLLRCLVTKAKVNPRGLTFKDVVALYDILLWAQTKSGGDESFRLKFGEALEAIARLLKSVRFGTIQSQSEIIEKVSRVLRHTPDEFCLPTRNFASVYQHVKGDYTLQRIESEGVPNNKLPPKQFIGKGYGDKGTAKKPWLDGSPSWQEVATNHQFQRQVLMKGAINEIRAAKNLDELLRAFDKYAGGQPNV